MAVFITFDKIDTPVKKEPISCVLEADPSRGDSTKWAKFYRSGNIAPTFKTTMQLKKKYGFRIFWSCPTK